MSESHAAAAAERLAEAIIDGVIAQPVTAWFSAELFATLIKEAALFHLRGPAADDTTQAIVQTVRGFFFERGDRAVRDLLPAEALALLRALIAQPYTPERAILVAVLSREPFRKLNRELMTGTMLDYSRKLRTTVEGGGKGLGMLGRFASEAVKKSTSAIGQLAPGMTSAVSDELERQMQRRASEFADNAVDEMVQRVATLMTDPSRAAEQLELKRAFFDVVLSLRGKQVAIEIDRMQPATVARELRQAALAWLSRPAATAELQRALTWLVAQSNSLPRYPKICAPRCGRPWPTRCVPSSKAALFYARLRAKGFSARACDRATDR
jgi:hypothetical protein